MLHDQLRHLTGYPDHTPGAAPATVQASKPLEGRCPQPVYDEITDLPDVLVDCGRRRPCPEHDRPVTLTPTEHTANQRQQLKAELADIDQTISTLTMLTLELLQRARRHAPLAPMPVPTCDATGLEGYLIPRADGGWSDLACSNPRSRGTLCDACSKRSYRWRQARGLTQLADSVWSQPGA